jgi:pimeloyl-ACP methyl ester carboxylesterase
VIGYRREVRAARARLAGLERHHLHSAAYGTIEYAQHGAGPALLIGHPLFGGFDAGTGLAATYAGDGFRIIAPSRFGYLGSTLPPGASPAGQADAYALLLDELGVDQAIVFGYSAGGPSTIQFALRHPDRTTALVLMASALPGKSSRPPKPVAQLLFGSDLAFWVLQRYLPAQLARLLVAKSLRLTPEQWATVRQTEASFLPVRPRKKGVLFDIYVSNPAVQHVPLEKIQVPTVVINAKDDPLSAFDNAARAAQRIPGAKIVTAATGGHLLLGNEQRVREEVAALSGVDRAPSPGQ